MTCILSLTAACTSFAIVQLALVPLVHGMHFAQMAGHYQPKTLDSIKNHDENTSTSVKFNLKVADFTKEKLRDMVCEFLSNGNNIMPPGLRSYLKYTSHGSDRIQEYKQAMFQKKRLGFTKTETEKEFHIVINAVRGYDKVSAKTNFKNIQKHGFHSGTGRYGKGTYTDIRVHSTTFQFGHCENDKMVRFYICVGTDPLEPSTNTAWNYGASVKKLLKKGQRPDGGHFGTDRVLHFRERSYRNWMIFDSKKLIPVISCVVPVDKYKSACRSYWNHPKMLQKWKTNELIFPEPDEKTD